MPGNLPMVLFFIFLSFLKNEFHIICLFKIQFIKDFENKCWFPHEPFDFPMRPRDDFSNIRVISPVERLIS